jgi:uncharacterized membrane protein
MPSNSRNLEPSELLNLYWSYYQLHADQRMKITELFITVETVLFGVFAAMFGKNLSLMLIISIAVFIIGLICYFLDVRSTMLLHDCRVAIREIENRFMPNYPQDMRLFTCVKKHEGLIQFSKIIRSCYLSVSLAGIAMIIISVLA